VRAIATQAIPQPLLANSKQFVTEQLPNNGYNHKRANIDS
jgi:hypothetical protein